MASMPTTSVTMDKTLLLCKKCGVEYERPVGSKWERNKAVKDEKRDFRREYSVKKHVVKQRIHFQFAFTSPGPTIMTDIHFVVNSYGNKHDIVCEFPRVDFLYFEYFYICI